jgi:hypothetical protein
LARDQHDRHPMIGDERMQDADGEHGAYEQEFRPEIHRLTR